MVTPDSPLTSWTLLDALKNWDNDAAWEAFSRRYVPFVEACARRAGLQEADVQEIVSRVMASFVVALKNLRRDPTRRFRGYVQICVRNAIVDLFREQQRRPGSIGMGGNFSLDELPSELDELPEQLESQARRDLETTFRLFEAAKKRLEPRTWQAFELTKLHQVEPEEAAKQLKMPLSTLRVYQGRVIHLLRKLAKEFEADWQ